MELWYALVDLLPFEWAQPGSMFFMKNALLAVLVITPLFGILSTMVVHSRMSFFSDALGSLLSGQGGAPLSTLYLNLNNPLVRRLYCLPEGELLEEYYPGLSEVPAKQLVVKVPAMSSDVNEIVLMQCETEEDAENAAAILQARVDAQVEGGAWYPETQAAWEKAQVLREGTYVALIASGAHQEALEEQFRLQFQSKE